MKKLLPILLLLFIFIVLTYVITFDWKSVVEKDFKSVFTKKKPKLPSYRYGEDRIGNYSPSIDEGIIVNPPGSTGDEDILVIPSRFFDEGIIVPK